MICIIRRKFLWDLYRLGLVKAKIWLQMYAISDFSVPSSQQWQSERSKWGSNWHATHSLLKIWGRFVNLLSFPTNSSDSSIYHHWSEIVVNRRNTTQECNSRISFYVSVTQTRSNIVLAVCEHKEKHWQQTQSISSYHTSIIGWKNTDWHVCGFFLLYYYYSAFTLQNTDQQKNLDAAQTNHASFSLNESWKN